MKTFKYKFTPLLKVLMVLGMILCVAGFAVNLVFCIKDGVSSAANPVYPALQYALMFFVTVVAFALLLSIMIFSAYIVDGKYFKTRFGFVTSKYDVEKIAGITLDRKTDKLTVTFTNQEFMVIVVKQDWYEDFVQALLAANPRIEYVINSLENDGKDGQKKS